MNSLCVDYEGRYEGGRVQGRPVPLQSGSCWLGFWVPSSERHRDFWRRSFRLAVLSPANRWRPWRGSSSTKAVLQSKTLPSRVELYLWDDVPGYQFRGAMPVTLFGAALVTFVAGSRVLLFWRCGSFAA